MTPPDYYDPITQRLRSVERNDLLEPIYRQLASPTIQAQEIRERLAQVERRGA